MELRVLSVIFLLSIFHSSLCSEDIRSDTSTNIKSSNEDIVNENEHVQDSSKLTEYRRQNGDQRQDVQRQPHIHQDYSHGRNHHETPNIQVMSQISELRVVDQSPESRTTTVSPETPPHRIIEVGEMILENARDEAEDTNSHTNGDDDGESLRKKNLKVDNRPNIILIMTDDQDVELGSMEYMPETLNIFRDNGVEFRHGFVATPMCCPSRSSILTGLYVHNHNVYTNNDNCSSVLWREKYEKRTFGAYLWSSGYYTSYIGKYLNKYDGSHIPRGWDEWNGLLMNSRFYNYTVNVNGRKRRHGFNYESDYYPDLIANDTLEFLSRVGNDAKSQPFLLVSSFPSPHGPEDSAPQYSSLFMNSTTHHTPSYNFAPNLDKQWILRQTHPMTPILKDFTNLLMAKRLQSLQSVDVAVKAIMDQLKSSGLDKNTYVFYTSDHGYHVGQFGLVKGKSMPYEFDIRVPFFVHGPPTAVKGGTKILQPVMNIDLAPTFLDLAGIPIPDDIDGQSLLPLIKRYGPKLPGSGDQVENAEDLLLPFPWRDIFLIESSGRRESPPSSTPNNNEMTEPSPSSKKSKKFREDKRQLSRTEAETARLNTLCRLLPHPCLPGQRRYCRKERGQKEEILKVQFKKCRQSDFLVGPFISLQDGIDRANSTSPRCRCRYKRSTELADLDPESEAITVTDWENERRLIDEEIELLKKRIDELRQRRRSMRRKWLLEQNLTVLSTPTPGSELYGEIGTSKPLQPRKGKGHKLRDHEEKVFSSDDFENEDEQEPAFSVTTTTPTTTNRPAVRESHEDDDDDDEDLDDEDDDGDDNDEDENDTSEEDDEEDEEVIRISTTSVPTTTTTTTTTFPTTTATTKSSRILGRWNNSSKSNLAGQSSQHHYRRPILRGHNSNRKPEIGLDFEGDFEFESFVRNKHRNKGRHKNRHRQKPRLGHKGQLSNITGTYTDDDITSQGSLQFGPFDESQYCDCHNDPKWIRQREREERKRKKLLSKIRKKQKYMKRIDDPDIRKQAETCGAEEKMNCFWHDNDHWKTAPFWTGGSFCFCMNSNNNTYSCLRSVNVTHNYLYCQFVTGFKMYFDLRLDPYQLVNAIGTLPAAQEDWMLVQLMRLKKCKGRAECYGEIDVNNSEIQSTIWEQIFARWPKKKKRGHRRKQSNAF